MEAHPKFGKGESSKPPAADHRLLVCLRSPRTIQIRSRTKPSEDAAKFGRKFSAEAQCRRLARLGRNLSRRRMTIRPSNFLSWGSSKIRASVCLSRHTVVQRTGPHSYVSPSCRAHAGHFMTSASPKGLVQTVYKLQYRERRRQELQLDVRKFSASCAFRPHA